MAPTGRPTTPDGGAVERVDQIVFRWDGANDSGTTGFGPVAWSGGRDEAEAMFRRARTALRASGEEVRPALIRLQGRTRAMLIRRIPWTDPGGGASTICHALVGRAELLEPTVCLGLHDWTWEGSGLPLARVRGALPHVREEDLIGATDDGLYALDFRLARAEGELVGATAELLRRPNGRFTFLDERGDTALPVLWGLYGLFGEVVGPRWTFATHDTAELPDLRFVFVGRWAGAASRNTDRQRSDPRERVGDEAESVAARLVAHHLRDVADGESRRYAVGLALRAARRRHPDASLLGLVRTALDDLDHDRGRNGGRNGGRERERERSAPPGTPTARTPGSSGPSGPSGSSGSSVPLGGSSGPSGSSVPLGGSSGSSGRSPVLGGGAVGRGHAPRPGDLAPAVEPDDQWDGPVAEAVGPSPYGSAAAAGSEGDGRQSGRGLGSVLGVPARNRRGPAGGARRGVRRHSGLEERLARSWAPDDVRAAAARATDAELLAALRERRPRAVTMLLVAEIHRRLPRWGRPLRRELCDLVIGEEYFVIRRHPEERVAPERRAADAADLHDWAVRPLLAGKNADDAAPARLAEVLLRFATTTDPAMQAAFRAIVRGRSGLPEPVWRDLVLAALPEGRRSLAASPEPARSGSPRPDRAPGGEPRRAAPPHPGSPPPQRAPSRENPRPTGAADPGKPRPAAPPPPRTAPARKAADPRDPARADTRGPARPAPGTRDPAPTRPASGTRHPDDGPPTRTTLPASPSGAPGSEHSKHGWLTFALLGTVLVLLVTLVVVIVASA
ncbi:hypothetical protein ACFY8W_35340 [Streptomyces sp. NPDC012637]|uniref:hypothetical protein n=1 Tax=Streptomyces sp. NPDC012637 TaxID=3364842 RepID=UPI0036E49D1D